MSKKMLIPAGTKISEFEREHSVEVVNGSATNLGIEAEVVSVSKRDPNLLTVKEASKLVSKSIPTIYQRINAQQVEIAMLGDRIMVKKDSLLQYYKRKWLTDESIQELNETGRTCLGPASEYLTTRKTYYKSFLKEVESLGAGIEQHHRDGCVTLDLWLMKGES